MKKLTASTLSLFLSVFFLPAIHVLGGGDFDGVFRPPSLDVNRIMDVDGRYEALVQHLGYDPLNGELQDRMLDVAGRRESFRQRFGYYPGDEIIEDNAIVLNEALPENHDDLGIFGNALQSEAARRLRLAEVDADADLEACMEAFANMLNDEANAVVPPPPPPLPVVEGNMGGIIVNPRIVVAASSNGGNHELSLAEQAVLAQQEMQKRRKKEAKRNEDQKEEEVKKLPPSDPHMQALFTAVEERARIVEQQLEVEAAMRAEEERLRLLEEEERLSRLNQEELEREAQLKAQQEKEAQERAAALKAQQEKEAQEQARLRAMKQQVLAGIEGGVVPKLKTTRLTTKKKKKVRSNSFAGKSSPREVELPQAISTSVVIVDYAPGMLADDSEKKEENEAMSSSSSMDQNSKKEEPQQDSWSFFKPWTWGRSASSEVQIQEVVAVEESQVEFIWNEIAEIIQLIDIGLPQNMMDSQIGIGPGQQFLMDMFQRWGAGFHRYLYYPAIVRVIRGRYQEATRIIAEELNHDEIDPGVSAAMGEALDSIGIILQGMDTWMQTESLRVAQEAINPSPSDFLIHEFPVFTKAMKSVHAKLKALFEQKGAGQVSANPLELGREHVFASMKVVSEELEEAEAKVAAAKASD